MSAMDPIAAEKQCPRYIRLSLNLRHDVVASRTLKWAKTGSSFYHSISRACVISVLFPGAFILNQHASEPSRHGSLSIA